MKTVYDVQQFLKQFGTYIYTGNRAGDLLLLAEEMHTLHSNHIIDEEIYHKAMEILLPGED